MISKNHLLSSFRRSFQVLCLCLLSACASSQETKPKLESNLDFEKVNEGRAISWGYTSNKQYECKIDSITVQHGKYAMLLSHKEGNNDFANFGFLIPQSYAGKKITLSGYIKTENVDGNAGLWMRIDPDVAFDNMYNKSIKGTTDWTKYEITLDLNPEKTTSITIGGLLAGKGKAWMDNLTLTIDGKDISTLTPIVQKTYPAQSDHEFDAGSKVHAFHLDKNITKNLRDLGLIWGFLKYHHPAIAAGNHNWDYALFRILPKIIESPNQHTSNQIFSSWIKSLGAFELEIPQVAVFKEIKIKPDNDWIKTSGFSSELQEQLLLLLKAKRVDKPYYIALTPSVGNPMIKNENPYVSIPSTDVGYRLLSLYRYWNLIQYFFPYKNLIEQDWKEVLNSYIPKMVTADKVQAYTLTTLELIGEIHDTHANIWGNNNTLNQFRGLRHAPLQVTFVENKAVVTGFHDAIKGVQTGLKVGDVLTSINGKPIDHIVKEQINYHPASNYATQLRDIANDLLRSNDTLVQVAYLRNNKLATQPIRTYTTQDINIYSKFQSQDTCFRMIGQDIAYINNAGLKRAYLPKLAPQILKSKGLIIDCRNYPTDFPIYDICKLLLPETVAFTKITLGNLNIPGQFAFIKPLNVGYKNANYYRGRVMILVNETTQSSAEFHAIAYSVHPNAQVIGSTTAGADGNVSSFYLPGGISTMFSGVGIYYPNGEDTQRVGVKIDVKSTPTIKGVQAGKDEVLEKAIQLIRQ